MAFTAGQKLTATALNAANQVVGGIRRTTNSTATSGTTELVVMTSPSLSLQASGLFCVEAVFNWSPSTTSGRVLFKIRSTNVSGTILVQSISHEITDVVPYTTYLKAYYATTSAEASKVFVATAQRFAGSPNITVEATSSLVITQTGEDTRLSTV